MSEDLKTKAKKLMIKLLYDDLTEAEGDVIYLEIMKLAPNPECLDYVYYSHDFYDNNGKLDIDAVIDKCFDYEPNIIAL